MNNNQLPLISSKQGQAALSQIKLLCCDVDGVMTDGGLYYGPTGQTMLKFNVLDGLGLKLLKSSGVKTCFITMSNNDIIKSRATVLEIDHCYMGIEDKLTTIDKLANELGLEMSEIAHIADDVNDLPLLKKIGCAITVPNAVDEVKEIAHFITERKGGEGAVRELCDSLIRAKATNI